MTGERKAPLPALTGLRFFLALWVVLDHAHTSFAITRFQYPAGIIFDAGYVAVGAFFALSGFILSYNYSLDDFWSRKKVIGFGVARFSRVFPSHCFAVVSLTPLVSFYVVSHFSMLKLGIAMGTGILSLTMLQAWIPAATLTWNPPAWSLSNEIFFYCCFPFAGILLWRLSSPLSICVSGLLLWMAALAIPLLAFQNHYSANLSDTILLFAFPNSSLDSDWPGVLSPETQQALVMGQRSLPLCSGYNH